MSNLLLYSLLTAAMFYLGSRATITKAIWSRYPPAIASWADCSACSSFWYGLVLALTVGRHYALSFLGLNPYDVFTPVLVGLGCMIMTPIVAGLQQAGFEQLGSAVESDDSNG